jgi:hypothetical protein
MISVLVHKNNYTLCENGAEDYWCSSKPGVYGRGILNTKDDPKRVERIGNLGEMAFSMYMKLPKPKFEYKRGGDDYDFLVSGKTIDVKCARKDYGSILIKCETETGKWVFQERDIYVASYIDSDDRANKRATVILVGWVPLDYVKTLTPVPSPHWRSNHKNYDIKFDCVRPMEELNEYINSSRDGA